LNYSRGGDDRFSVTGDAPGNGWLYVAEPFYPGWEVYVDGKRAPMERALDAFIKVKVPAGAIDARFVYRPGSWILGLWISLLSVVGLAWLGAKKAVNFA
jgi:uncharacterized membrane protein YfhO